MKCAAAIVVLLLCLLPRSGQAQSVASIQRLQRMVWTTHVRALRPAAAPAVIGAAPPLLPSISYRAFAPAGLATLRQQVRLPLHERADFTLGGRLGVFGLSTTARFRLRF